MLGPELTRVHDAGAPFVWTAMAGADGSMFLGTGNDGKVIKIDSGGRPSRVLRQRRDGSARAGAGAERRACMSATSPDGRIYRVDAKGQATPFFDPDDKYIWSLAVDREGIVFAATGDKGTVYKISAGRQGHSSSSPPRPRTRCRSRSIRSSSCSSAPARRAACSASTPPARASCCSTRPYQEVARHSRRPEGRDLCGGAEQPIAGRRRQPDGRRSRRRRRSRPRFPTSRPRSPRSPSSIPRRGSQPSASLSSPDRRNATGAMYRVQPDGLWDEIWESRDDAPYDIAIEPDGSLLVATGTKGKIFRLSGDPVSRRAGHARAGATGDDAAARARDRTYVATANPGLLMALSSTRAAARHLRVRRQGRADGRDLGRDHLARHRAGRHASRALHALGQHEDAGRSLERLVGVRTPTPPARRSPARRRATSSGARC